MVSASRYVAVGVVAAVVTFVLTPLVAKFAHRVGWVVAPDARRVHTRTTPDVGGIAMFFGFLAAMAAAWGMDSFRPIFAGNSEALGVLIGCGLVFAVGLIDDVHELSAPAKVTGIVIGGVVLTVFGVTMFYFRVPFMDVFVLGQNWVPLMTVLWLLGLTNAINLIDGLDGLAAGIVAIAAMAFFVYSRRLDQLNLLGPQNLGPLLAVIAAGVCIGFLPHNFNPAKIFMGDGGALFLGALMAVSTSVVGGRADPNTQRFRGQTYFFFAPLVIPIVILGVPILDMLFAIIRRATRRQGLAVADKGHLHHRLMNLGHGQRRAVLILWAWTALLSGFVLYPAFTRTGSVYAPAGLAALALVLYTVLHPRLRARRESAEKLPVRPDGT
ncbi:MAG: UDP-N-acetylglucosamine--undecaprenyl-phosphate N-acetylglucosamine-phosphate transferase [Actinomycetota bacterium]|jgi:UDP-GlcNAc:undecaprenyl-phosphate GlcNAc-1-phosphate transferase